MPLRGTDAGTPTRPAASSTTGVLAARGLTWRPLGRSEATLADVDLRVEAGERVLLGAVPSTDPATPPTAKAVTERVHRLLDMLCLEPTPALVVTPGCGLAGASPAWARTALSLARLAARDVDS